MVPWLRRAIFVVLGSIVFLTFFEYGVCVFWENPRAWIQYKESKGEFPDSEHTTCKNIDDETRAALIGVLATLLALATPSPPNTDE